MIVRIFKKSYRLVLWPQTILVKFDVLCQPSDNKILKTKSQFTL